MTMLFNLVFAPRELILYIQDGSLFTAALIVRAALAAQSPSFVSLMYFRLKKSRLPQVKGR